MYRVLYLHSLEVIVDELKELDLLIETRVCGIFDFLASILEIWLRIGGGGCVLEEFVDSGCRLLCVSEVFELEEDVFDGGDVKIKIHCGSHCVDCDVTSDVRVREGQLSDSVENSIQ
jgi:hypothetical protein